MPSGGGAFWQGEKVQNFQMAGFLTMNSVFMLQELPAGLFGVMQNQWDTFYDPPIRATSAPNNVPQSYQLRLVTNEGVYEPYWEHSGLGIIDWNWGEIVTWKSGYPLGIIGGEISSSGVLWCGACGIDSSGNTIIDIIVDRGFVWEKGLTWNPGAGEMQYLFHVRDAITIFRSIDSGVSWAEEFDYYDDRPEVWQDTPAAPSYWKPSNITPLGTGRYICSNAHPAGTGAYFESYSEIWLGGNQSLQFHATGAWWASALHIHEENRTFTSDHTCYTGTRTITRNVFSQGGVNRLDGLSDTWIREDLGGWSWEPNTEVFYENQPVYATDGTPMTGSRTCQYSVDGGTLAGGGFNCTGGYWQSYNNWISDGPYTYGEKPGLSWPPLPAKYVAYEITDGGTEPEYPLCGYVPGVTTRWVFVETATSYAIDNDTGIDAWVHALINATPDPENSKWDGGGNLGYGGYTYTSTYAAGGTPVINSIAQIITYLTSTPTEDRYLTPTILGFVGLEYLLFYRKITPVGASSYHLGTSPLDTFTPTSEIEVDSSDLRQYITRILPLRQLNGGWIGASNSGFYLSDTGNLADAVLVAATGANGGLSYFPMMGSETNLFSAIAYGETGPFAPAEFDVITTTNRSTEILLPVADTYRMIGDIVDISVDLTPPPGWTGPVPDPYLFDYYDFGYWTNLRHIFLKWPLPDLPWRAPDEAPEWTVTVRIKRDQLSFLYHSVFYPYDIDYGTPGIVPKTSGGLWFPNMACYFEYAEGVYNYGIPFSVVGGQAYAPGYFESFSTVHGVRRYPT